ncbi:MAG: hypothetical protein NTW56_01140 [Alphaproteobacteria bacterium]|nr:hypothetical protein [Alphaproteobacteria bacterium]
MVEDAVVQQQAGQLRPAGITRHQPDRGGEIPARAVTAHHHRAIHAAHDIHAFMQRMREDHFR